MSVINVIYGPPCAGKSSFAQGKKKSGDVIVDFDLIAKALGSESSHDSKGSVRLVALSARLSAINRVMRGIEDNAYIIHTAPQEDLIKEYKEKKVKFILVDPGIETCLSRAKSRPEGTEQAVRDWYNDPPQIEPSETIKEFNSMAKVNNLSLIADELFLTVKNYISSNLSPVHDRIKYLESRQPEKGEKGDKGADGQDGKSVTIDEVLPKLEQTIIETVKSIPIPKDGLAGKDADEDAIIEKVMSRIVIPQDGKDGQNGKDADESAIAKSVIDTLADSNTFTSNLVNAVLKMIPTPKDGKDGLDGKDGEKGIDGANGNDGQNGKDGKDADEDAIVERVLALIPIPKDGENGRDGADGAIGKDGSNGLDGKDGANGLDGKDGADGKDGIDGKSITLEDVSPILESAISKYALEFERRAYDVLQKAVDDIPKPKDGERGEKGADGFGIEKFEQRGDREVVAIYRNGDEIIEQSFKFPALIDRGVYKSGEDYEKGDGVTYGGSFWIAQKDHPEDAPGNSDSWRLAVKKGRDGKDFKESNPQ